MTSEMRSLWLLAALVGVAAPACDDDGAGPGADGALPVDPEPEAAEPEPEAAEPEPEALEPEPDAAEPEPDAAAPEPDAAVVEPWPEPLPPDAPGLTVVYDGRLVAPGEAIRIAGPPAGLDHPLSIDLVLTWRGVDGVELDADPAAWLDAEGFAWRSPPPPRLEPDGSARVELVFDPTVVAEAGVRAARLTVPGADVAVDLEVDLRRPLRLVIVGDAGELFVSDAYGEGLRAVDGPLAPTARHRVTWGAGRFFRSWAAGGEWGDPGVYAWSADGETWTAAQAAPEFWSSGCAYGLDRFACAVGDRLAWSLNGSGIVHEATAWRGMLHAIAFADDRWVAVGREARRVVSLDGVTWAVDQLGGPDAVDDDWYFGVASAGAGRWIAAGGQNSTLLAVSEDGGETWRQQRREGGGARTVACLEGRCVISRGGQRDNLLVTDDGETFTPVHVGDWADWTLLGTVNGWFIAAETPWQQPTTLHRSRDGETWSPLHTTAEPVRLVSMAVEGWEPAR